MEQDNNQGKPMTVHEFTDALIRVGMLAMLVIFSFRIFNPFMNLMLWALILAVTIYPGHQKLAAKLGGMVSSGFTGLFTGAVILSVGYQIFMQWVATKSEDEGAEQEEAPEET